MTAALDDLTEPIDSDSFLETLLDGAKAIGLDVDTWKPLDPTRTLYALTADLHSLRSEADHLAIRGGLLDYAADDWLTLLAINVYGVTRKEASFASVADAITLTNAGGGVYNLAAGELVVQNTTTKKNYKNTEVVALAAFGTQQVDIIAEEAGTASNASIGQITTLVTTLLGVTVTNTKALVATDKENDPDLRQRCRDKLGALSPNGAAAAYAFVAKSTPRADGTIVDINRVKVSAQSSTGTVTVTVASPSGVPASQDVTDVNAAIQATVVPLGVTATVAAAVANTIAVTYTAYVANDAPETNAEIQAAIATALANYFKTVPIGGLQKVFGGQGKVWIDELSARISEASSATFTVDVTVPAADVNIATNEVPVLGTIMPTITRVVQQ